MEQLLLYNKLKLIAFRYLASSYGQELQAQISDKEIIQETIYYIQKTKEKGDLSRLLPIAYVYLKHTAQNYYRDLQRSGSEQVYSFPTKLPDNSCANSIRNLDINNLCERSGAVLYRELKHLDRKFKEPTYTKCKKATYKKFNYSISLATEHFHIILLTQGPLHGYGSYYHHLLNSIYQRYSFWCCTSTSKHMKVNTRGSPSIYIKRARRI